MADAEAVGDAMAPKTQEGIWGSGAAVFLAAAQIKCQRVVHMTQSQSTTKAKDGVSTTTSTNDQKIEVPSVRGERLAHDLGVFGTRVKAIVPARETQWNSNGR